MIFEILFSRGHSTFQWFYENAFSVLFRLFFFLCLFKAINHKNQEHKKEFYGDVLNHTWHLYRLLNKKPLEDLVSYRLDVELFWVNKTSETNLRKLWTKIDSLDFFWTLVIFFDCGLWHNECMYLTWNYTVQKTNQFDLIYCIYSSLTLMWVCIYPFYIQFKICLIRTLFDVEHLPLERPCMLFRTSINLKNSVSFFAHLIGPLVL